MDCVLVLASDRPVALIDTYLLDSHPAAGLPVELKPPTPRPEPEIVRMF